MTTLGLLFHGQPVHTPTPFSLNTQMVAHYNAAGHLAFSLITDLGNYSALYVHSSLVLNVRAVIGGVGL